uniref:Maestro heat-like repeat-containing protein family member 1 n=1 Tax=Callorhinchus milii TaxID=7868 RepID=A0A4W3H1V4_CALMI
GSRPVKKASLVALTDAAFDKDEGVRWQIKLSLHDLGCHNPELVLRTCLEFLVKHKQLVQGHRMAIISSMEAIVRDTVKQLSQTLGKNIISMASDEMTKSSEGAEVDKLKEEASNLLVAVGCRFSDEVLAEIQQKLQPGHLPQFHEVQTLGKLSVANVYGVVPHLPGILQTMTPMLSMARQDHMKMAFTSVLGLFAQSILEYLEHSDRAPNPVLKKSLFSQEMYACYKILFSGWLRNKDNKLRSAIVVSLSYMVHLIPDEKLEDELPKLISGILTLYKKRCEPFYVTRCIWHILDTGVHMTSQVLDSQIDNLLPPLHHQICSSECELGPWCPSITLWAPASSIWKARSLLSWPP